MKKVSDGWHKVYDLDVMMEDGKITRIVSENYQGYRVRVYPYWKVDGQYTSASLHGMTLDEFRGYVRRKTIYFFT